MKYCYVCGEKLYKAEVSLVCVDGCGLKIEKQVQTEGQFCYEKVDTNLMKMAGDLNFCFKCSSAKLTKGKKHCMCGARNCDVKIPIENVFDFLEEQVDSMKYCYICGEELYKAEAGLMCIDGCGLKIEKQANTKGQFSDEQTDPRLDFSVKFCFKCFNTELTKGKKFYMCGGKKCDVKIPKEDAFDFLEKQVDCMKYCYVCGEELYKAEVGLMCVDGCGLKIQEQLIVEGRFSNETNAESKLSPASHQRVADANQTVDTHDQKQMVRYKSLIKSEFAMWPMGEVNDGRL